MVRGSVVLSKVISNICASRYPENVKLSLVYMVTYLVEMHVHGVGLALFDAIIGDAISSSGVIGFEGGWQLGAAHFF
jgi:hypothetical protein